MIIKVKKGSSSDSINQLCAWLKEREIDYKRVYLKGSVYLVTSAQWKHNLNISGMPTGPVEEMVHFDTEYQLSARRHQAQNTVIDLGDGVVFGANKTVVMAGPCAVESLDQTLRTAEFLSGKLGVKVFRAGAFKPRTSPYSFQGLESEGLRILDRVREEFGMRIITEVKDNTHLDEVADCADIIQIGTKSMYLFNLLAQCGGINKPVLLKRGFMATIKEFLQAVDFIMSNGNPNVILCERGIRTFEPQTRFCLDVCSAALLREISHLPIVIDPSHAMGRSAQVPLIAQAAAAMEIDGILVEVHPNPDTAKSDKEQQLSFAQFEEMMRRLNRICESVNRKLV
ncbi:MAG: 3-deoxy-7-phosphoheptulonate synthase [Bacillota bacterium]|nr:3-deoxy-7-phosphoheptulonate synthase [Bacillota bacterium]